MAREVSTANVLFTLAKKMNSALLDADHFKRENDAQQANLKEQYARGLLHAIITLTSEMC